MLHARMLRSEEVKTKAGSQGPGPGFGRPAENSRIFAAAVRQPAFSIRIKEALASGKKVL